jgi:hypothetical protein
MNPLTKPLNQITFEDVEAYCAERRPETTELDYKRQLPRDLAKHIAAMSNTFGGIIIIGVEEDKTGHPIKWDGVPDEGKLIDHVYQQAANVKPYPSCYVEKTNAKDGKVFLLVRVLEGTAGPYYSVTDSQTVWMRTGNISTPLKPAERDAIERISGKREKATTARTENEISAKRLYHALFEEQEKQRQQRTNLRGEPYKAYVAGQDYVLFRLLLQPYYPQPDLITGRPATIRDRLDGIRVATGLATFPDSQIDQVPGGIAWFNVPLFGYTLNCGQLYTNGMLYWAQNIMRPGTNIYNTSMIYMNHAALGLYQFLEVARRFYNSFNYHGLVTGSIAVDHAKGYHVYPAVPQGHNYIGDLRTLALDAFSWPLALDTHKLNDTNWLLDEYLNIMERIYWDLRLNNFDRNIMIKLLRQAGLIPTPTIKS